MKIPTLQASKWLSCQMLLETEEMRSLFAALGNFYIAITGTVNPKGTSYLTHEVFLEVYQSYIENLKRGQEEIDEKQRKAFAAVFTLSKDDLYLLPVGPDKELVRVIKPIVQLQYHQIGYSEEEKKFRPLVFGKDCLSWGLQFSYPQLVQDIETHDIKRGNEYPNYKLFQTLQKWMRENTIPTPFHVEEKKINAPMRLGKQCLNWINTHPGLCKKNIHVH